MLTSDLLLTRSRGPYIEPRYVAVEDPAFIDLAQALIEIHAEHQGKTRRELQRALHLLAGDRTDYRIQRGLAKLLCDHYCEFHVASPQPPEELRHAVFTLARAHHPVVRETSLIYPVKREDLLEQVALKHQISSEEVLAGLYADLPENHQLATFAAPSPNELLLRYNVALAQAMLYRCEVLRLSVYRNLPVRYKQLFKFIKFYRLIHTIEGDVDAGYEIALDGPVSMFRHSQKYGLQMAVFLPALLLCTRWSMQADIVRKDGRRQHFVLDDQSGLGLPLPRPDPVRLPAGGNVCHALCQGQNPMAARARERSGQPQRDCDDPGLHLPPSRRPHGDFGNHGLLASRVSAAQARKAAPSPAQRLTRGRLVQSQCQRG